METISEIAPADWKICMDVLRAEHRMLASSTTDGQLGTTVDGQLIVKAYRRLVKRQHRMAHLHALATGRPLNGIPRCTQACLFGLHYVSGTPKHEWVSHLYPLLHRAAQAKTPKRSPSPVACRIDAKDSRQVCREVLRCVIAEVDTALDPEGLLFLTRRIYLSHRGRGRSSSPPQAGHLYNVNELRGFLEQMIENPFVLPDPITVKTLIRKAIRAIPEAPGSRAAQHPEAEARNLQQRASPDTDEQPSGVASPDSSRLFRLWRRFWRDTP